METIEIDRIDDNDKTFCISYPLKDGLLFSSVTRFGLLSPLVLFSREKPVVVTGFKRLEAARTAGITEIPCVFLDKSEKQAILTAISDNLKRPLNIVEKAHCIDKMHMLGFMPGEVDEVMKLLSLPVRRETMETSIGLASAQADIKDFIARIDPPMGIVEQLFWFDDDERRRIATLAIRFKASMSHFREILRLVTLLKVRKGSVDYEQLDAAGDVDELKQMLRKKTHPMLAAMEEQLARLSASCGLAPNINVNVDPNFEKDSLDIRIQARNGNELDNALAKLKEISDRGLFRSIFELTHGEATHN